MRISRSLISVFSEAGHDAMTAIAQDLGGKPDASLFETCCREGRALVTLDKGFADIRAYPPQEHAGVIVLKLNSQSLAGVVEIIGRVIRLLEDHPIEGTLWIVDDNKVRFRR